MKILHAIPSLAPSYGGPPRVALRIAAVQAQLGHVVTIASHGAGGEDLDLAGLIEGLPGSELVDLVELGATWYEKVTLMRARERLTDLVEQADIVHLHEIWSPLLLVTAGKARSKKRPYIVQPNDSLNPWSLRQKKWKKRLALGLGFRKMIEGSSLVLSGHPAEREAIESAGFRVTLAVAPIGAILRSEVEPMPPKGRFYQRLRELDEKPFALFMGRLHLKKGLDYLAESFAVATKEAGDAHLVVIGHDEGARNDFERRIRAHGLTRRVHMVGPMHGAAKWEALRDATCLVLLSRDETFTIAVIEALAVGLPVVVSEQCHLAEIDEYGAGIVVPLVPEVAGNAIADLLSDPVLRDQMSFRARRLFEDELCLDKEIHKIMKIYEDIVASA